MYAIRSYYADYLFRDGSMIGLNRDILCQYVEYISNLRMQAVGLTPARITSYNVCYTKLLR